MQDTVSSTKGKGKIEWHKPRIVEVFYPLKIKSTQDRHNWINGMMLDSRLNGRDKTILTRLALHLNLKTGQCDPTIDLLALETSIPGSEKTARRMVRRSLEQAEKVGWIERTGRHGGARWNRSNSYRLTIPKDVRPDKIDTPIGQNRYPDRTPESGRIGKENREGEYSLSSRVPQLALGRASKKTSEEESEGSATSAASFFDAALEERFPVKSRRAFSFEADDVQHVQDVILAECGDDSPVAISKIIAMCREPGVYEYLIDGAQIGAMAKAGFLCRDGNDLWVDRENVKRLEEWRKAT